MIFSNARFTGRRTKWDAEPGWGSHLACQLSTCEIHLLFIYSAFSLLDFLFRSTSICQFTTQSGKGIARVLQGYSRNWHRDLSHYQLQIWPPGGATCIGRKSDH